MTIRTISSDEARLKLRDILDDVQTGKEVVIERYRKPAAVVVNYDAWQRWRRQRGLELLQDVHRAKERFARDETSFTPHDELKRLILERRTEGADNHAGVGD